nr:PhF00078.1 [Neoporphyra haitanensis]
MNVFADVNEDVRAAAARRRCVMTRPPAVLASPPPSPPPGRRPAGGGGVGGPARPLAPPPPTDAAVMRTNDDAAASKAAAVAMGYLTDPYLAPFVQPPPLARGAAATADVAAAPRRAPLINRGTATRVAAVDAAVATFGAATAAAAAAAATGSGGGSPPRPSRQVLSLGAGFDTRPFGAAAAGVSYVEVDFPAVAAAKWRRLGGGAGGNDDGGRAGGGDLRDAARLVARLSAGGGVGWDWAAPTLLLTELVLVYMDAADSARLLAAVAGAATGCLAVVNFEQIRPDDPFGMQMVTNIAHRGSPLRGLAAVPDLRAQVHRFRTAGWTTVAAVDMRTFYYRYLTPARRAHIESLELLDEVEEWHLLLEHYALVWGARDPRATGDGGGNDSVDGGDGNDADDPSVCDSAPGQRASPFVAAFMLRPVPRQATAPGRAAPPPPLGRPAAAPPRGGRLRQPRGGCDDLFPGAHLAGAE